MVANFISLLPSVFVKQFQCLEASHFFYYPIELTLAKIGI